MMINCYNLYRQTIKIIAKFVNKGVKSYFAIPVRGLTIWYVLIQNWKKLQKGNGVVLIAKEKAQPTTTTSTWNFVEFVKTAVNCCVAIAVRALTTRIV